MRGIPDPGRPPLLAPPEKRAARQVVATSCLPHQASESIVPSGVPSRQEMAEAVRFEALGYFNALRRVEADGAMIGLSAEAVAGVLAQMRRSAIVLETAALILETEATEQSPPRDAQRRRRATVTSPFTLPPSSVRGRYKDRPQVAAS